MCIQLPPPAMSAAPRPLHSSCSATSYTEARSPSTLPHSLLPHNVAAVTAAPARPAAAHAAAAPAAAQLSDAAEDGFAAFCRAAQGANIVPLYQRIFSDQLTPVLAYRWALANADMHSLEVHVIPAHNKRQHA